MARDLAVVLSSGSVNSAVTAMLAGQRYRLILLHARSQQASANSCEVAHHKLAESLRPYRELVVSLPAAGDGAEAEDDHLKVPSPQARLKALVPLLGWATQVTFSQGAAAMYCGLRVGSDATALTDAMQVQQIYSELLQVTAGEEAPELVMPLLELEPHQVVDLGVQVRAPLDATWSCLESGEVPCGQCMGCRLRLMAFAQAQQPDPLPTIR